MLFKRIQVALCALLNRTSVDLKVCAVLEFVNRAVLDPEDAVGCGEHLMVVGGGDDRHAKLAGEVGHQFDDVFTSLQVQVGGWFVGEDNGGFVREGAGDGNTLLLTTGHFIRAVGKAVTEANHLEDFNGALARFIRIHAAEEQRQGDVADSVIRIQQVV